MKTSIKNGFWISLIMILCYSSSGVSQNTWQPWPTPTDWNGNWNEANHWSAGTVPTFDENVHFPVKTIGGAIYTVDINTNAACNDISIHNNSQVEITGSGTRNLFIYGAMSLGTNSSWMFNGKTHFESESPGNILSTPTQTFAGPVYFNGDDGDWSLSTSFNCSNVVYLVRGTLIIGNQYMTVGRFETDYGTNTRTLSFNGGTLEVTGSYAGNYRYSFDVAGGGLTVWNASPTSGSIILSGNDENVFGSSNVNYPVEIWYSNGNLGRLLGTNNFFRALHFNTNGRISEGINTTNVLTLQYAHYMLDKSCVLNVLDQANALGTCDAMTTVMSPNNLPGVTPVINFGGGAWPAGTTMDFLIINGVDATFSSTAFAASRIYNMQGNIGWPVTTNPATQVLYWTGAVDDSWSNLGNWQGATCSPAPIDILIWDPSKITGTPITRVDRKSVACQEMIWMTGLTAANGLIGAADQNVSVYGSMTNANNPLTWTFAGNMRYAAPSGIHSVDMGGVQLAGATFFEGKFGQWDLQNDYLSFGSTVYALAGHLNTNNFNINTRFFNAQIDNTRTLELHNSIITCEKGWDIYDSDALSIADPNMNLMGNFTVILLQGNFQSHADFGDTRYFSVEFHDVNAYRQHLYGANTFSGHVLFLGNGTIPSNNTYYDLLTFSPGRAYNVGNTQEFLGAGTLDAIGYCDALIGITGGTFEKLSLPDVTVEYCVIKNNTAVGVVFTGDYSFFTPSPLGTWTQGTIGYTGPLYFKAQAGNNRWNDGQNWYINPTFTQRPSDILPLGTYPDCPPTPANDVYLITGSFALNGSIDIDVANAYCHSMYWKDGVDVAQGAPFAAATVSNCTSFLSNAELNIFGALTMAPPANLTWGYNNRVRFQGNHPYGNHSPANKYNIDADDQTLLHEAYFDGISNTDWTLTNDFAVDYGHYGIDLIVGEILSDGYNIDAGHFWSEGSGTRSLDLTHFSTTGSQFTTMTLNVATYGDQSRAWDTDAPSTGFGFVASTSEVFIDNVTNGGEAWLSASDIDFNEVTFMTDAHGYVMGDDLKQFNNLSFLGNGELLCGNTFVNDLLFSPGYVYHLQKAKTQSLGAATSLTASGTASQVVYIRSTDFGNGNEAIFSKPSGQICLDYAYIRDNDATGGARFFDGNNGYNVSNNTGWSFFNCGSIQTVNGCAGPNVSITSNISNGIPPFNWAGTGTGTWTGTANPGIYKYTTTGTFTDAMVTVNTANSSNIEYFDVVITNNCCSINLLSQTNTTCFGGSNGSVDLEATAGLPNYTWSNGGGSTSGLTTISGLTAGSYVITATGSAGCVATTSVTITEPTAVTATMVNPIIDICAPATATAEVTAGGGIPGYSYVWSQPPPPYTHIRSGLTAGFYTVTVSDANSCTATANVQVNNLPISGFPKHAEGISGDAHIEGISGDDHGFYYVCGWFSGTMNYTTSSGTMSLTSAGGTDAFVIKYSNCDVVWARSYGDVNDDDAVSIVVDQYDGSRVYFCGNVDPSGGSIDFDPGAGIMPVSVNLNSGYVAQLNTSTGMTSWINVFSAGQGSETVATKVNINRIRGGNELVHVSGQFNHQMIFGQYGTKSISTQDFIASGSPMFDAALFSIEIPNNYIHEITSVGGIGDDIANSVTVDPLGTSQQSDFVFFTGMVFHSSTNNARMTPAPVVADNYGQDGQAAFVSRCSVDVTSPNVMEARMLVLTSPWMTGSWQSGADLTCTSPTDVVVAFDHDGVSDMAGGLDMGYTPFNIPSTMTNTPDIMLARYLIPTCPSCSTAIRNQWFRDANNFHLTDAEFVGGIELSGPEVIGIYNSVDASGTDIAGFAYDYATATAVTMTPAALNANPIPNTNVVVSDIDCMAGYANTAFMAGYFDDEADVSNTAPNLMNANSFEDGFAAKLDVTTALFLQKDNGSFLEAHIASVYPNPSSGNVRIEFPEAQSGVLTIQDAYGRIVYKSSFNAALLTDVDLSFVADGMYLMTIESEDVHETHRIIKQ